MSEAINEKLDDALQDFMTKHAEGLTYKEVIGVLQKHFLIWSAAAISDSSKSVEEFSENTKEWVDQFHKQFLSFYHSLMRAKFGTPEEVKRNLQ